ncbi:MAG: hypothetical protein ACTHLA_10280 [Asticcacaulis sp.]|jgi:hypothetical protein|uniref:hypothetical protein n=1 Tax=Asticcacaulis sp. TaxID=1872648 RepID=UPI003F7C8772
MFFTSSKHDNHAISDMRHQVRDMAQSLRIAAREARRSAIAHPNVALTAATAAGLASGIAIGMLMAHRSNEGPEIQ